jgi:hypothetical protein
MLQTRSIAVSAAVVCFLALGLIGSIGGLSPDVCCQRALLGAVVAYIAVRTAMRAVVAILTHAIITSEINKDKGPLRDGRD